MICSENNKSPVIADKPVQH